MIDHHYRLRILSENSEFSIICADQNIKFIGTASNQFDGMGDKNNAKYTKKKAGKPVIPGSDCLLNDLEEGQIIANKIKYPINISATADADGRGLNIIWETENF